MITANFKAYASYVTDSLNQWDLNQVLQVSGLNQTKVPEVHFSNANIDRAIVRQATMNAAGVVAVGVPNSLLQDPLRIYAHIGIYEGDTFKVVELVEIPVMPRKRPADYQIQDADEEIYSFKALENAIANMTTRAEAATISARIDTIVANANKTDGNSELVDIRVGADGKKYTSAGAAVREQFTEHAARVKEMTYHADELHQNGKYRPALTFENKHFTSDTGKLVENAQRAITNFVYCPPGARVDIVCSDGYMVTNTGNYDESGKYLGHGPNFTGMTFRRYVIGKRDTEATITPEEAAANTTVTVTTTPMITKNRQDATLRNYAKTVNGKNLLDRSASKLGYISDNKGGILAPEGTTYYTSAYIPVKAGKSVTVSPRLRKLLAYDENFIPMADTLVDAESKNYTFTPAVDGYIRFTYYDQDENVQAEYGPAATEYERYKAILDPVVEVPASRMATKLNGKTGVSFGDSIMYGSGNGGTGILDILGEKHGVHVNDYSVGGASVEKIEGRSFIGDQIAAASAAGVTPDFVLLDGLSNDIVHGTMGEMGASFDYAANGYATFASGLEYCIGLIKDTYPTVPVVYVLPHSSAGRDYAAELKFGDLARAICKKWSVPIADIYRDGNINARVSGQMQAYTYYPTETTGTHPNRAGYDRAYIPIITDILNKIL